MSADASSTGSAISSAREPNALRVRKSTRRLPITARRARIAPISSSAPHSPTAEGTSLAAPAAAMPFRPLFPSPARIIALWCVVAALNAAPASAQYFGQNKVQYKKFDFQVLKTEHFDIYYYPAEQDGIAIAARLAERWHARLEKLLAHQLRGRQPLVLYASHADFEQTNAIQGELGEGTGGVTEPLRRRIVLPMGWPLADTAHVIGHELVPDLQFDITTPKAAPPGQTGAEPLPLWFIEGMAEY